MADTCCQQGLSGLYKEPPFSFHLIQVGTRQSHVLNSGLAVLKVGREQPLQIFNFDLPPTGQVLQLVVADFADVEVNAVRMA